MSGKKYRRTPYARAEATPGFPPNTPFCQGLPNVKTLLTIPVVSRFVKYAGEPQQFREIGD